MDRAHTELLAPLKREELRQEARRAALADLASSSRGPNQVSALAVWLGGLLIQAGCRLEAAGRRRAASMSLVLLPAPYSNGK
jgi:hypothetical protein